MIDPLENPRRVRAREGRHRPWAADRRPGARRVRFARGLVVVLFSLGATVSGCVSSPRPEGTTVSRAPANQPAASRPAADRTAGRTAVQPAGQPTADQADITLPRDTNVVIGTLENGLRYYIRANQEPRARVELRLVLDVGSILEDDDQRGIAHMVEHMAFNGTTHFSSHQLVDYLESVGMRFGPDVNAYVSFDETVFMLTLPTDSVGVVETGLQILEDWAHGITFDPDEVERERGVVIEEWRLQQGAAHRLHELHFPHILAGSRYPERVPIGTRASLDALDHHDLRRFYRDWYRPDLMAVVVVGDIDPAAMEVRIRERFGALAAPAAPRPRTEFTVPGHQETIFSVGTDPEQTGTTITITKKIPARPGGTTASYRRWLVEFLASTVLTDRLLELTQRPGAALLDLSTYQGRYMRPTEALILNATVADDNVEAGLRTVVHELERLARYGAAKSEVERKKAEILRLMEQRYLERDHTTSAQFAGEYVSHFLYGGSLLDIEAEYDLYRRLLPEIEASELTPVIEAWLDPADRVITLSAPARPGRAVPDESRLAAVVHEARGAVIEPYTDEVSDAPLLARPPTPGAISAERRYPDSGITEWRLENGVRVLLKSTDFQEDLIILGGQSPGGTSLISDEDYKTALLTSAVVQSGGMGELSSIDLQKRLAGKHASVGISLDALSERISGAASPRDIELLFQLVYLRLTEPRRDSAGIAAYRARARTIFENRGSSPEAHLQDTLRAVLAQYHPRARPLTTEDLDRIDIDRAFQIFQERFGDAGDFTFYLVGRLEPDSLRPHIERYLGGLPTEGRRESWRDLGIETPRGIVEKVVRKGLEPKATVQLVFTGPFDFDRANLSVLGSLGELLRLRLRESLREDQGGTYGVQVGAGGLRDPRPEYRISIGFSADPERVDELLKIAFAEIDSIKRHGPTPAEASKIIEMRRRAYELNLRDNHYWITQMMNHDLYGWDLNQVGRPPAEVEGDAFASQIREAARRYLDTDNYVQVLLLPEEQAGGPTGS